MVLQITWIFIHCQEKTSSDRGIPRTFHGTQLWHSSLSVTQIRVKNIALLLFMQQIVYFEKFCALQILKKKKGAP